MIRRAFAIDLVLVAAAVTLQVAPLPQAWIEDRYANGIYAALATTFVPLANRVPFALGDLLVVGIVAGTCAMWVVGWRRSTQPPVVRAAMLGSRTLALVAAIALWFDGAWALNYRRAPLVDRVDFAPSRVTAASVAALSRRIIADLNATAPLAHADRESEQTLDSRLAVAFTPVVARLGDRYAFVPSRPKTTAFNGWFARAGIGGQWDPFAYETLLNADFLRFERPFALAHEWGHVAGFGDESDANAIAALTTLRSADPLIRYSGLFWAYGFLPAAERRRLPVSPLVARDLAAARARFLQHYDAELFALQWFVYDKYLRVNRVPAGVVSYSLFVEVLAGTSLDRDGLPCPRPPITAAPDRAVAGRCR